MKKIISLMLAIMMLFALSATAFADSGFEGDPEYQEYDKSDPSNTNNIIPGWGYIGIDATIEADSDPDNPPTIEADDSNINVELPVQFLWAAFESQSGAVTSPSYYIKNNSQSAALNVTLVRFVQTDSTTVPSSLQLNLVGTELGLNDVLNSSNHNHQYSTSLAAGGQWNFTIGGTYTGAFTIAALGSSYIQPQYEMVFEFSVDI